jgi:hypothetical protein
MIFDLGPGYRERVQPDLVEVFPIVDVRETDHNWNLYAGPTAGFVTPCAFTDPACRLCQLRCCVRRVIRHPDGAKLVVVHGTYGA